MGQSFVLEIIRAIFRPRISLAPPTAEWSPHYERCFRRTISISVHYIVNLKTTTSPSINGNKNHFGRCMHSTHN